MAFVLIAARLCYLLGIFDVLTLRYVAAESKFSMRNVTIELAVHWQRSMSMVYLKGRNVIKWKYPMRLHEMLAFPDGMEEITRKHVADYPMNIIQVAHLTKEERARLTSDFRIVAEYLACKNDKEKWTEFLADTKEIRHVEEILDVIWELSDEGNYKILSDKIKKTGLKRRSWNMCEIARELERIGMEKGMEKGIEKGMEKGIMSMIRDNLDMGNERTKILEKIVHYFSISTESAQKYYERTMAQ